MAGQVSSVSWYDGSPHLRVYTVVKGKSVTEQAFDGSWYKGDFQAQGTAVGATSWFIGNQIYLRVYVANNNGPITEYTYDGNGWHTGEFQADGMDAAATSWLDSSGQIHIRVYVRSPNGTVTEYGWDGDKWYVGGYSDATASFVTAETT